MYGTYGRTHGCLLAGSGMRLQRMRVRLHAGGRARGLCACVSCMSPNIDERDYWYGYACIDISLHARILLLLLYYSIQQQRMHG